MQHASTLSRLATRRSTSFNSVARHCTRLTAHPRPQAALIIAAGSLPLRASFSMAATSPDAAAAIGAIAPQQPAPYNTRTWVVSPSTPAPLLEAQLAEAAALLQAGELVAFPTETVYGLGGNALSSSALAGIYVAKGRPSDNPLIVHVHSHAQFLALGRSIPRLALRLAEKFWPGPLTLIIPTSLDENAASSAARAGLDCVGVRMPSHPVALALLRACGVPLAAPSANLSGRPSPTTAAHVSADLGGRVAGIVDGGSADGVGLESTVVECEDGPIGEDGKEAGQGWVTILRPGGITREMLEQVAGVGRVRIDPAIAMAMERPSNNEAVKALPKQSAKRGTERADVASLLGSPSASASSASPSASAAAASSPSPSPSSSSASPSPVAGGAATPAAGPKAPGMKYTHYAPRAPLLLVDGSVQFLLETARPYLERGEVVGVLATSEQQPAIETWRVAHGYEPAQLQLLVCGQRADLASVARGLYGALRAFDETNVQIILSEIFPAEGGMGEALMNRLQKAAGGRVVREDTAPKPAAQQ